MYHKRTLLTPSLVAKAAPGYLWDAEVPGLGLRVQESGTRSWVVRYRLPGGSTTQKFGDAGKLPLGEARRQAKSLLAGLQTHQNGPALIVPIRPFSEFLDVFLDRRAGKKRICDDRGCIENYIRPSLGHLRLNQITRAHVADLHAKIAKRYPATANQAVRLVRNIFNRLVDWGILPESHINPATRIKLTREKSRSRVLTDDEVKRLLRAAESHDLYARCFIRLLLLTACRKNEILKLRWEQVSGGVIRWPDTKSGRPRVLHLSPEGAAIFDKLRSSSPWVFPGRDRSKPRSSMDNVWWSILKEAGLKDVHLHDLRRTAATWLAGMNFGEHQLQLALGHADVKSSEPYVKLAAKYTEKTSEALAEKLRQIG